MSNPIGIIDIDGSAQPLVTLHENEAAAVAAGSSLVFRRLRSSRDDRVRLGGLLPDAQVA